VCGGKGRSSCGLCFLVEDSDYVESATILEEQDEFARNDLVNNLLVEFMNIFDKGYRCIVVALLAGGWKCLQPFFSQR
jgi:hypothetical protein